MKIQIGFKEVIFLSIFFTSLALFFDIYGQGHVISFIIDHVLALLIALFISRAIYYFLLNNKFVKI